MCLSHTHLFILKYSSCPFFHHQLLWGFYPFPGYCSLSCGSLHSVVVMKVTVFKAFIFKRSVLYFCFLDYILGYFLVSSPCVRCQCSLKPRRMIYVSSFLSSNNVSSLCCYKCFGLLRVFSDGACVFLFFFFERETTLCIW